MTRSVLYFAHPLGGDVEIASALNVALAEAEQELATP